MEQRYKLALVQMHPENGARQHNLARAIGFIEQAAKEGARIVCLPELFYSGYFLNSYQIQTLAEPCDGPMVQALCEAARENGVYIIGGYAEADPLVGRVYNSAIFIDDEGKVIGNTRKCYLWKNEKKAFRSGDKYPLYDTPLGKIGILLCYDMEFPEPARILALKGAQIVFSPSAWSAAGLLRWQLQLRANAMFNLMFVAGANNADENCCGSSFVVGPDGVVRGELGVSEEGVLVCEIDLSDIVEQRCKIPYMNDFREDTFSMEALRRY